MFIIALGKFDIGAGKIAIQHSRRKHPPQGPLWRSPTYPKSTLHVSIATTAGNGKNRLIPAYAPIPNTDTPFSISGWKQSRKENVVEGEGIGACSNFIRLPGSLKSAGSRIAASLLLEVTFQRNAHVLHVPRIPVWMVGDLDELPLAKLRR